MMINDFNDGHDILLTYDVMKNGTLTRRLENDERL